MEKFDQEIEDGKDKTTRYIATGLLYTFISAFAFFCIINSLALFFIADGEKMDAKKEWIDLLKSVTIALSSALTTVIGYYFGQRVGNLRSIQANEREKVTKKEALTAIKKAVDDRNRNGKVGAAVSGQRPETAPTPMTTDLSGMILPDLNSPVDNE